MAQAMDKLRRLVIKLRKPGERSVIEEAGPHTKEEFRAGSGHALATLPSLPAVRRPVTATVPDRQLDSFFFGKLPPEIRQQIYLIILAGREIHLDMRYSAAETVTPHSTAGAFINDVRQWRWRAHTCHRHPDAATLADSCGWGGPPPTACKMYDSPCEIGKEVLGLLLSCRMAYREGIDILYGNNTFHITSGALLLYTPLLLPAARSAAVTSLIYSVKSETVELYAKEHLALQPGLSAYEQLILRIAPAFPSLKKLSVAIPSAVAGEFWRRCNAGEQHIVATPHFAQWQEFLTSFLLRPMDRIVESFEVPLEECVYLVESQMFVVLVGTAGDASHRPAFGKDGQQFWRSCVPRTAETPERGYWIRREFNPMEGVRRGARRILL